MPRLFGLNPVGALLAAVVFFVIGHLWYNLLFQDVWLAAQGLTVQQVQREFDFWLVGGFLITLVQVIGLGLVMRWRGVSSIGAAALTAFVLWLVFALPFAHYAYIYSQDHNPAVLMVDASHLLAGWVAAAVVLAVMK